MRCKGGTCDLGATLVGVSKGIRRGREESVDERPTTRSEHLQHYSTFDSRRSCRDQLVTTCSILHSSTSDLSSIIRNRLPSADTS